MPDSPEDAVDVLVGGRYRLHNEIGQGGMGAVWRATDELLGRVVAIKRVRLGSLPPDEAARARERTMREARIAAALHHPHVVSIFDVVIEDGEPWLILEYVPSRSLGAVLREQGPMAPGEVAEIGAQIAAGLAAAHAAGVVHRDVKPDNVLIAGTDPLGMTTAKLTDFGISRVAQTSDITAADILSGTPAYLAPEAARGEGTGPRSDMYSLGATLYTAVEGHPPFGSDQGNVLALLTRVGRGGAPEPSHAGPLTDILCDLVADDPASRPTAVETHRVLRELSGAPLPEHPVPPPAGRAEPTGPEHTLQAPPRAEPAIIITAPKPRPRWVSVVASVLTVLAVTVAAVLVVSAGQDAPAEPTAAGPDAGPPIVPGAITVADQRTADPCSLLDADALGRYGAVAIDSRVPFAACRAVLTPSGEATPLGVTAEFESAAQVPQPLDGTAEQSGPVRVVQYPQRGPRCARRVLLPDSNAALVTVSSTGAGGPELCAIADTAVTAAIGKISVRGIGTRAVQGPTRRLAGVDACVLLSATELAAVPGIDAAGRPGFGNWSCEWISKSGAYVRVAFARRAPLTPEEGTPTDFAGHAGALMLTPGSDCFAQFPQGTFTAPDGVESIDAVQLFVYRSLPDDQLCPAAAALATAAARKLPPLS